jgi:hypothetical protein
MIIVINSLDLQSAFAWTVSIEYGKPSKKCVSAYVHSALVAEVGFDPVTPIQDCSGHVWFDFL